MVTPADHAIPADTPGGRGRIGVLIEAHFDETEFHRFNEVFPAPGYELVYCASLGPAGSPRSPAMTTARR